MNFTRYMCCSRAIYLDLVIYSSGPACISMLNRFFNTFGAPKRFISDNGGAFVSEETQLFIKNRNVKWTVNKQDAPWTTAFFERLLKSVKRCLKKILGKAKVNFDEMNTKLRNIRNVLNNRPLTFCCDDLTTPLVPNHLM